MRISPDCTDHAPSRPRHELTTNGAPLKYSTIAILVEQALDDVDAAHLDLRATLQLLAEIAWQEGYDASEASGGHQPVTPTGPTRRHLPNRPQPIG
ncbi:MAG: hypothetical protein JWQ60_4862 [Pseudonocardia sp.]|nr:hypothetical protein [Pseudonocardia sp.]